MAGRIRSIKPETLEDERPAALSDAAWRLWVSMWLLADDHGNCRASGTWLAAQVWWAHEHPPDVDALLAELERAGSIRRYVVRGQAYAHVERWERHQRIDNAGKSRVPTPDEADASEIRRESPRASEVCRSDLDLRPPTTDQRTPTDPDAVASGAGVPGGVQGELFQPTPAASTSPLDFVAAYQRYPRKEGRKKGLERAAKQITTREQYDRFVRAIEHYAAHVAGRETDKIKHFDTFVGCYEDYVEGPPPSRPAAPRAGGFMPPRPPADETREEKL
jgi:hypothetical protein